MPKTEYNEDNELNTIDLCRVNVVSLLKIDVVYQKVTGKSLNMKSMLKFYT